MAQTDISSLLDRLAGLYPALPPQLAQAARHILDAPEEVAMRSMRSLAGHVGVAPTTMVRLAQALGFASYKAFRRAVQEAMRQPGAGLAGRAEWLQELAGRGDAGEVMGGMAQAAIANIETSSRGLDLATLAAAADALGGAACVHVVGIGGMHGLATYFAYVARMVLGNVRLAEPAMGVMVDELATLGPEDVLVIAGVDPYGAETVRAAEFARARGTAVVAITDSRASPLAPLATHLLIAPTASPQFFPSQAAIVVMMETLIALLVSRGGKEVIRRIEAADRFRAEHGVYWRSS